MSGAKVKKNVTKIVIFVTKNKKNKKNDYKKLYNRQLIIYNHFK